MFLIAKSDGCPEWNGTVCENSCRQIYKCWVSQSLSGVMVVSVLWGVMGVSVLWGVMGVSVLCQSFVSVLSVLLPESYETKKPAIQRAFYVLSPRVENSGFQSWQRNASC